MYDVFISYARSERTLVVPIAELLQLLELSVFMDVSSIDAGSRFPIVIDKALKNSRCVIACWSPTAFTREWVMNECVVAKYRNALVPLCIEPIDVLDIRVDFQGLDYADLSKWDRSVSYPDMQKLLRAVSKFVGRNLGGHAQADLDALTPFGGAQGFIEHLRARTWMEPLTYKEEDAVSQIAERDGGEEKIYCHGALWRLYHRADEYCNQHGADLGRHFALLLATHFRDGSAAAALADIFSKGYGVPADRDTASLWRKRSMGDWSDLDRQASLRKAVLEHQDEIRTTAQDWTSGRYDPSA